MPSELVSCPECKRKLRVPHDLVGKMVKCPTCGQTFTADVETLAPPPPPPPPPAPAAVEKPTRTSKVERDKDDEDRSRRRSRDDEDDDEDRSRRGRARSRRDDDDEDGDRPRRRRSRSSRDDDDEDDEDRPRRRRRDLVPHRASTILALGIISFFFMGIILGPMAWVMGNNDLAEMRAGRMDREGESSTNAGRTCGMISTILHIVMLVLIFGLCCAGGLGGAAGGRR